jgi:hypothetical protein
VIAAAAGAPVIPSPYRPVLRGLLLAGTRTRYLRHEPGGESEVSRELLWWPPTKIAGRYLSPYLAAHLDIAPVPEASGAIPVRSAAGSGVTAPLR